MIPGKLKKYFWDMDFKKLDAKKNSYFIIERILEYGDLAAVKWLIGSFNKTEIKRNILKSRRASSKSAFLLVIDF